MFETHRALYLCRHCQTLIYRTKAEAVTSPPCPRCHSIDFEGVVVPPLMPSPLALGQMLAQGLPR
ncbi:MULTISPECIES: hypothetical protein [Modicisalibacter]|uniref:hypothetical protein n=1 Tax=Modicisalibacter TaxID=574347 RepID=UPI00100AD996|nr:MULTISPECIES: hypothetical protein [Halomonadaceae]MBZ9558883.1 hypothetical protein [Modicisalibacter sp. R2A 31.J]MBZ9575225.1 hypothetical protein [Modicisalibacter sp. MOD 31.J]